ncbi:CdaR family protein [Balneolales bacterium ANBcel1]|nr:CdaR family protein [Balneolales bacterium ANBcel1]
MDIDRKNGNWLMRLFKPTERETTYLHKREILIVFLIGYVIALSLWLLVNLGREYSITLEVPLQVVEYSDEMAFSEPPPASARVGISGEGWNLFSLYRNPPEIVIPYERGTVSVADRIQEHLAGYPDLVVNKVAPSEFTVAMEMKTQKRVPVAPRIDVRLESRFEIMGDVRSDPDSVTVTGAESVVDTISSWPTEILRLRNVKDRVEQPVRLAGSRSLVSKDTSRVVLSFDVTEFTEGEVRVYVQARNIPEGEQVRLSPSVLTIRYDVPIEHYSRAQEMVPYEAYVDYFDVIEDTTGFLVPEVRPTTEALNLRLRSFQPRRVSYFRVIGE